MLATVGTGNGVVAGEEATRPTRIIQEVPLHFPLKLQSLGYTSGEVDVLLDIDALPKPLVRVAPRNPAPLTEPSLTGRVRLEFYIDEEGNVRMPVVVTADDERLGWAAIGAVAKWRFEVPRRGGYPVLVRAQQDFFFAPES